MTRKATTQELIEHLYCFNPLTGKHDGSYCIWEGVGKCLMCQAAELLQKWELELKEAEANKKRLLSNCDRYIKLLAKEKTDV